MTFYIYISKKHLYAILTKSPIFKILFGQVPTFKKHSNIIENISRIHRYINGTVPRERQVNLSIRLKGRPTIGT